MSKQEQFRGRLTDVFRVSGLGLVVLIDDWQGRIPIGETIRLGELEMIARSINMPRQLPPIPNPRTLAIVVGEQDLALVKTQIGSEVVGV